MTSNYPPMPSYVFAAKSYDMDSNFAFNPFADDNENDEEVNENDDE